MIRNTSSFISTSYTPNEEDLLKDTVLYTHSFIPYIFVFW